MNIVRWWQSRSGTEADSSFNIIGYNLMGPTLSKEQGLCNKLYLVNPQQTEDYLEYKDYIIVISVYTRILYL